MIVTIWSIPSTALLAGRIPAALLENTLVSPVLFQNWQEALLIARDSSSDDFRLTGNGSWFVGNMISQLIAGASAR